MRRYILALATTLLAATTVSAETNASLSDLEIRTASRGMLLNRDIMTISDIGSLSRSSALQYGSARSMAMAGALTSLGGDASSMMINPAGLGMAIDSDLTITPLVTIQNSKNSAGKYYNDGSNNVAFSNFSTTFNLYESAETKLVSLNVGLGYNRVADLNYNYSFASMDNSSSIARLFSRQLTADGVSLNELIGSDNPDWSYLSTNLWGAALGYKTGLTFQSKGDIPSGYYNTSAGASSADNYRESIESADDPLWEATWISDNASVDQYMSVESVGSIGEYDIAFGANVDNKLYVGFTLGIQSVYQRLDLIYGEEYNNPNSFGSELTEYNELNYANYNQAIITRGSGVNVKIGASYRLDESLRVGVAYHSPTYYSLSREYQASMASASTYYNEEVSSSERRYVSVDSPILEDTEMNRWKFRSPSRLLLGASYTYNLRALISIDYECAWYGSMAMRSIPYGVSPELYDGISDIYKSVNTIRMGGEYKLSPQFALRGGYSFSGSMVRDDVSSSELLDMATTDKISYYSAGIGWSPNRGVSFDLTYMRQRTKYTNYTLFYSAESDSIDTPTASSAQSGSFSTRLKQNNIALSMIFRM
ncbi:MAG: outer membrane protein transport protein [Rikenellaceae bacterium]